MALLFADLDSASFGPGSLSQPAPFPTTNIVHAPNETALRERMRKECPNRPGVYGMLDADGRWIYVGKSKTLRTRVQSYFRVKTRASKERRILDRTVAMGWEPAPTEFAALLRELELIQRFRPSYNVKGQPGSREHTYICIGKAPAAYAYLDKRPGRDALGWYGPIPEGMRARETVRRLNDWFRLRDCPHNVALKFVEQQELFPIVHTAGCIRFDLLTCLGPCAGGCSTNEYSTQVNAARRFLSGEDVTPLESLARDMQAAVDQLEFERAAGLNAVLVDLRWVLEHLGRLRVAKGQYSFVYPQRIAGGRQLWYLIHGGLVATAVERPRTADAARKTADRIASVFGKPPVETSTGRVRELDFLLLVASWFRQFPDELRGTLTPDEAVEYCHGVGRKRKPAPRKAPVRQAGFAAAG